MVREIVSYWNRLTGVCIFYMFICSAGQLLCLYSVRLFFTFSINGIARIASDHIAVWCQRDLHASVNPFTPLEP